MKKIKQAIHAALLARVQKELIEATHVALSASEGAKSESMKSDGKYDTRGIEAGYLAGAQLKRVEELKLELQMIEELPKRDFAPDEELALGALAQIEHKGLTRWYFLSSTAGGTLLSTDEGPVLVISVFSPIGDAALGLKARETFELETPNERREYTIVSVA